VECSFFTIEVQTKGREERIMSEIKSALDLRKRLFSEVAGMKIKANVFSEQVKETERELAALEKNRTEYLEKLVAKCRGHIPTGELKLIVDEIDVSYKSFQEPFLKEKSRLLKKKESAELEAKNYSHEAYAKFNAIINEILDWQFGRGELVLVQGGISRVFGKIAELGETYHCIGHFVRRENDVSSDDVKKIAEACKNNQAPLVHVTNMALMPLDASEVEFLCKKDVNYELLKKIIPRELVPWRMPFIYLLKRDYEREMYMAPLNDDSLVFFRVDHCEFPCCEITFLGKTRREEDAIREFSMFSNSKDILDRFLEVSGEEKEVVFYNFCHHYLKLYPGLVIKFI
jgi:hypothetical protein